MYQIRPQTVQSQDLRLITGLPNCTNYLSVWNRRNGRSCGEAFKGPPRYPCYDRRWFPIPHCSKLNLKNFFDKKKLIGIWWSLSISTFDLPLLTLWLLQVSWNSIQSKQNEDIWVHGGSSIPDLIKAFVCWLELTLVWWIGTSFSACGLFLRLNLKSNYNFSINKA